MNWLRVKESSEQQGAWDGGSGDRLSRVTEAWPGSCALLCNVIEHHHKQSGAAAMPTRSLVRCRTRLRTWDPRLGLRVVCSDGVVSQQCELGAILEWL